METKTYRIHFAFPALCLLGIVCWGYTLLYYLGLVPWMVVARVGEFDLREMGLPVFLVFVVAPCVLGLATVRLRASLGPEGISYRGILRSGRISWKEITLIVIPRRAFDVYIYVDDRRINLTTWMRARKGDLKNDIVTFARRYAPNAVVAETHPRRPFWPWSNPSKQ